MILTAILKSTLRISALYSVMFSAGLSFVYASETSPIIEYAYPDQSVWTTKVDEQGVLKNPLLHVAEELFAQLNLEWSAKPYPAARMFERLERGDSNFSMLVKAPRLLDSCNFSKEPIVFTELRVYRKANVPAIETKEDLQGKSVIVIHGYSYGGIGKYVRDKTNNVLTFEAKRHESAFNMLAYNRADYLLDYMGPSDEVLTDQPIPGVTYDTLTRLNVYLVLIKDYPDSEAMMRRMEHAASTIDPQRWGLARP